MATQKGRNVKVEIAATFSTAKTVTAITKANPGVVTSTAHGLTDGAIGYFDAITGMDEILGQAASVDAPATNTFNLEGLDTTVFGTAATAGSFTPVATWATLSTSTDYEIGGGSAEQIDTTVLLDKYQQFTNGMLAAQTFTIGGFSDAQNAAALLVRAAARSDGYIVVRITFSNGERRVFRGQPSLPGETLANNQMAKGSFTVTVKGEVLSIPA
jgi:hypothetical protein